MDDDWARSALSRLPRPLPVTTCRSCGRDRPAGYADCAACHEAFEAYWLADWAALLEREGVAAGSDEERLLAQVVLREWDRHPFTVLDIAMTTLVCDGCGRELGASSTTCWPCKEAFGNALAAEANGAGGPEGAGSPAADPRLDHAWHIGRWVVRHPDQHSPVVVAGWTASLPRLLAGDLPTTAEAQRRAHELRRQMTGL
ncbi:MAG TPA: hypothetical protein VIK95_13180 [Egibacteraceae bacterium]